MTILPRRHLAFVVLSALLLTCSALGALAYLTYTAPCGCQMPRDLTPVMKAAGDISANEVLTEDLVVWEEVPRRFLPPNYIGQANADLALGAIVQVDVKEGCMILESDLVASIAPPRAAPHAPTKAPPVDLSGDPDIPTPEEIMPETER